MNELNKKEVLSNNRYNKEQKYNGKYKAIRTVKPKNTVTVLIQLKQTYT